MSKLKRGKELVCATPHLSEEALGCDISQVPRDTIPQAHRDSHSRRAQCSKIASLERDSGPRRRESIPIRVCREHALQRKICLRATTDYVRIAHLYELARR